MTEQMATTGNGNPPGPRSSPPLLPFRGWVVVAGCFAATLCTALVIWSFGVFFNAIQADLGGSRGAVAAVYTTLIAAHSSSSILTGRLSDRGHAGRVLQVAAVAGSVPIALCSMAQSLTHLALLFALAGLSSGTMGPLAYSIVQRVFHMRQRAGLALAIVSSGIGLGALVFAPLLSHLMLASGWRNAFLAAGLMFFALASTARVAVWYGGASSLKEEAERSERGEPVPSRRRFITSREFLALAVISLVAITARQVVTVHLIPLATDVGVAQTVAALALGLIGGLSIPGRIGSGLISDAIGWRKTVRISVLGTAVTVLLLPLATRSWILITLVVLFGFWHGARAVGVMGLVGQVFRMHAVGHLIGTIVGLAHLASALGPYIAGLLYDRTGSYSAIFLGLGAALLVLSLAVPRVAPDHLEVGESAVRPGPSLGE
ncbi:MFS transporter [Chloroflexota bacterium]